MHVVALNTRHLLQAGERIPPEVLALTKGRPPPRLKPAHPPAQQQPPDDLADELQPVLKPDLEPKAQHALAAATDQMKQAVARLKREFDAEVASLKQEFDAELAVIVQCYRTEVSQLRGQIAELSARMKELDKPQ